MRHYATSRKVAGSIPDGVAGIFHLYNPSGRTMALGSTQPLTEMSTRNIPWRERRPLRRADNLTTFMCRLSCSLGASNFWNPQGLSRPVMVLLYLCFTLFKNLFIKYSGYFCAPKSSDVKSIMLFFSYYVVSYNFLYISYSVRRNCLLQRVIEEKIKGGIEVTRRRGRRRRKLLDDLKERRDTLI